MSLPIGPDHHYHLKLASEPHLSADGELVAFTVRYFDRQTRKEIADIHVADVLRGNPRRLIAGAESPRWSPDGSTLAFLRRDDEERTQLWVADADGGNPRRLTSHDGAVDVPRWSPDGSLIAFRADVDGSSEETAGEDGKLQPRLARRIRYHEDGAGWRGDSFRRLFTVDPATATVTRLTSEPAEHGPPVWSPDGRRIAYVTDHGPFRDTTARNDVYVIPAGGGGSERWSGGLFASDAVTWSADGERIAVIGAEQPEQIGGYGLNCQNWVYVIEPGMCPRRLSDDSVRPLAGSNMPIGQGTAAIHWAPDGRIYFIGDSRGQSYVCSVDVETKELKRITGGGEQISGWDASPETGSAVIVYAGPGSVGELSAVDLESGSRERLTRLNDGYFSEHPPAILEKFIVRQDAGDVECRLWLPPDFDPSVTYPVVLDVHGGPHSVFYDAFYPIHQVAATNGYIVVAPNPRGSSTYGEKFATAVHGDWGGGDYLDVMAALGEALKRPYMDESRVVLHGSSYGGYLASWAVGHTDRFSAAVIAAPVTNLVSFYGTSDIGVNFSEVQFAGGPQEHMSWYIRHSPLTYAQNVSTPILLIHGEDDRRVSIEQSEQYFVALKRAGKNVEFMRLPETGHGIFRAKHPEIREEYFHRMLVWFESHLRETTSTADGHADDGGPRRGDGR